MAQITDATELVFRLFAGTGATYDEVVERATLGLDSRWKRAILERMRAPRRVLDLASGTGIVSLAIASRFPGCEVTGVELQPEYCRIAEERARAGGFADRVRFVCAAAEEAPLEPAHYDHAVTSYLPKYARLDVLVPRLEAALVPGGRLVFHDFTQPADPRAAARAEEQLAACLALAEARAPEWVTIFRELPGIIRRTTWVEDLLAALRRGRWAEIGCEPLSMGCAAIVSAVRASP
jgi:demethylmenaquinone methyltransferase/2-methoxy-6-polyprenyl-1,4-benzoquinol methylase